MLFGGTGLYANSLIYGIEYNNIEFDEKYREYLEKIANTEDGLKQLYNEAKNAINEKCMASLRLPEIKEIQGYMKKPVKYCPVHTKMLAMCSYRRV